MSQYKQTDAHPIKQSSDPRVVRTRIALRNALAEEIRSTGDLSQVTVTAVTERAGITRRTFYIHYRDIPHLVDCIEDEALNDLRALIANIAAVSLDELEAAIAACEPCPGSVPLLEYFAERGSWLAALLGDGGDPSFAEQLKRITRDVVYQRAQSGFELGGASAIFDYYLTYAISAEVGVLVRWLTTGMHESVDLMARVMTGLMFVRPGDLYAHPVNFNLAAFGLALARLAHSNGSAAPAATARPAAPPRTNPANPTPIAGPTATSPHTTQREDRNE